jgi:hypothetical protein
MTMQRLSIDMMTGPEFEAYVGEILRYHGYFVEATRVTGDFGVDLVARRYAEVLAVQCKRLAGPVGAKAVEEVTWGAAVYGCTSTMVVSNQSFTAAAIAQAKRHNSVLIDGAELSRLATGWRPDMAKKEGPKRDDPDRRGQHSGGNVKTFARYNRDARVAVALAQELASAQGTGLIRVEHLLLGVLEYPGHHLWSVLRGFGLNADVIRDRLQCAESSAGKPFEDDVEALRSIGIDLCAIRDASTVLSARARTTVRRPRAAGPAAGTQRLPNLPRKCLRCPGGKPWRTRTTGSVASTSFSA